MPVDLHQRLSEFSYGYGVTRQVECLLASVGHKHRSSRACSMKQGGSDVEFDRSGTLLLLQIRVGCGVAAVQAL